MVGLFRKPAQSQKEIDAIKAKEAALTKETERLQRAYDELFKTTNKGMGDLLGKSRELGIRLPQALIDSITQMVTLGHLTEENTALINELASSAEVDWRKMEEAAERYGIQTDTLGQVFNQLKIDDAAEQIIDDFDMLKRGGADMGAVMVGMSDEISALVQRAMALGLTLPENMRPWITELQKAGLLVDEQGQALTDLSRLNFGDPITTAFEEITTAIEDLVRVIREELVPAFNAIPNPGGGPGASGYRPPSNTPSGEEYAPSFAAGTMGYGKWFGNFGGGTPATLHNEEAVVTRGQAPAFAADVLGLSAGGSRGGGGSFPVNMIIGNRTVFAEIVMEDMDSELAIRGIRP